MASPAPMKITYTTTDAEALAELHRRFDQGLEEARSQLGQSHHLHIGGRAVEVAESFEDRSPGDTRQVLGRFASAGREHTRQAIDAAHAAWRGWAATPYRERTAILRGAGEALDRVKFRLAAAMALEIGKTRIEALAEVEEAEDLIRAYCDQIEQADGFVRPMATLTPGERNRSVLKPYGVFAVVAPFNFPLALSTGMAAGALVGGNTVVFKPASDSPWLGMALHDALVEAGLPAGAFNFITGPGGPIGEELLDNPKVGGIVFTGSRPVGHRIYNSFSARYARPCITEMGGKNPTIVSAKADLAKASEGVARSAFGYSGQKCSACSRVYVERPVAEEFTRALAERARELSVGDPSAKEAFTGPVISAGAYRTFQEACEEARRDGGRVLAGGEVLKEGAREHGYYCGLTVVDGLPLEHRLFRDELFVPFVVVGSVGSLDEALREANASDYGLTGGIFSEDEAEVERFFDEIEVGVAYSNRRAGATTGAWPGAQSFCGWKASGSTGKGGLGPYYVQQFLREQSQTRVVI